MAKEKIFDVDDYLKTNGVTLIIKGKKFTVEDISYDVQAKFKNLGEEVDKETDEETVTKSDEQKDLLVEIVGCSKDDLKGYGMVAINSMIRYLMENLFPEPSQKVQ